VNIRQAKDSIRISDFLAKIGHQPAYTAGGEHWYNSPLPGRQDKTPSFKTDRNDRLWIDQATRQGGTIIELAMLMLGCESESAALHELSRLYTGELFDTPATVQPKRTPAQPQKPQASEEGLPLFAQQGQGTADRTGVEILFVTSKGLYWYLHHRGIEPNLAKRYLKEIRYQADGKPFYALAFPSDAGGYELRNGVGVSEGGQGFKGAHGPKAITTLHADKATPGGAVSVFEGFFDFLSALAYYGKTEPDTPIIVMNSTAMHAMSVEAIQRLGAGRVYLYLDHDATGREATEAIRSQLPGIQVEDRSHLYAGYEDFNAFWRAQRQQTPDPRQPMRA